MRYLSISAPFVFQNLVPAPITLFLKNVTRKANKTNMNKEQGSNQYRKTSEEYQDAQLYDLDLKHNSQQQILFLNPLGNFDLAMVIPGYEKSNFMAFKDKNDEDKIVCDEIKQYNHLKQSEGVEHAFKNEE